ncbi:sulfite exporter TauE/SafE family protein [Nibrella saemangeumensis]|uniref:Sulfite exporter TauE/SafE family protein n=1 Tax=Nibrella saemangeumensis TaxID=1084526 RepID=A0ABP8MPE4_9BACT
MNIWWTTAVMAGLAGSLHCVGMCGPLAMALPVGRLPRYQRAGGVLLYHAGRISAYALLGLVTGLLGHGLLLAGIQGPVSIASGVLLLLYTLTNRTHLYKLRSSRAVRWVTAPMTRLLQHPTLLSFTSMGFLNGLLPCGFVYVALAGALNNPTPPDGALYMILFGLGTLPALLGIRFAPSLLPPALRQRLSPVLPVATALLAVFLIVRGLTPYAHTPATHSPAVNSTSIPDCHGTLGN